MRIAKTLPQFIDRPALILLIGGKSMRAYRAHAGAIELIAEYVHTEPHYTDREGFYSSRGHGKNFGGGIGGKRVERIEHDHFLRELKKRCAELWKDKQCPLYIFVAKHLAHDCEALMPAHARARVYAVVKGNHVHDHPFTLLALLQKREMKKTAREKLRWEPTEVQELLRRGK